MLGSWPEGLLGANGRCSEIMRAPIISVLLPVYNSKRFLIHALESLGGQTFRDYEVVAVDDGSTDSSGTICDKYCKADNRVSVIHKQNGGLVSARKAGIPFANGEYVSFVDSDDWIDNDMYERGGLKVHYRRVIFTFNFIYGRHGY